MGYYLKPDLVMITGLLFGIFGVPLILKVLNS